MKKLIILLILVAFFPLTVLAENSPHEIRNTSKTIFDNVLVEDICSDIQNNSHRAATYYKDKKVALIGTIESISADGKKLFLKDSSNKIEIEINLDNSDARKSIDNFSVRDNIVCSGTIKDLDESSIEMKCTNICKLPGKADDFKNGKTCGKTVYTNSSLFQEKLNTVSYTSQSKWERNTITAKLDSVYSEEGIEYKLDDDETIRIYCFDWKEIKKSSEIAKNDGKEWLFWDVPKKVEIYALKELNDGRWKYKQKSEKINGITYEYFPGEQMNDVSPNHSDVYFVHKGDCLMAVCYRYENTTNHLDSVALLLGSLSYGD